jgi:uncharacterized protein YehS (DUF1456 family)
MIRNDVIKKLRFILDFNDQKMLDTYALGEGKLTRSELSNWLKKDDDPAYVLCKDIELATFLNGLVNLKRGKREGESVPPESKLSNNTILRKLTIAFSLKSDEVIDVMKLADFNMGKPELSAFFRKPTHKHYRECKSQILRNFLMGLQLREKGN